MLLVTTDIGSRGLDTTMVDHVVMYDFPKNGIDYLHRAGRTGRVGQVGHVTCLVGRKDKRLAATIERTIRMRKPLGWRPTEKILGKNSPTESKTTIAYQPRGKLRTSGNIHQKQKQQQQKQWANSTAKRQPKGVITKKMMKKSW
jgi:superfamily II DNA/RNA helicase